MNNNEFWKWRKETKFPFLFVEILFYIGGVLFIYGAIFAKEIGYLSTFGLSNESQVGRIIFIICGLICIYLAWTYTRRRIGTKKK